MIKFKIIFTILIIFFTLLILDSFYKIFFKVKFLSKKTIMTIHYLLFIFILHIQSRFKIGEINKENIYILTFSLFILIFIHIKNRFFDILGIFLLSGFSLQIIYWIYKLKDLK